MGCDVETIENGLKVDLETYRKKLFAGGLINVQNPKTLLLRVKFCRSCFLQSLMSLTFARFISIDFYSSLKFRTKYAAFSNLFVAHISIARPALISSRSTLIHTSTIPESTPQHPRYPAIPVKNTLAPSSISSFRTVWVWHFSRNLNLYNARPVQNAHSLHPQTSDVFNENVAWTTFSSGLRVLEIGTLKWTIIFNWFFRMRCHCVIDKCCVIVENRQSVLSMSV